MNIQRAFRVSRNVAAIIKCRAPFNAEKRVRRKNIAFRICSIENIIFVLYYSTRPCKTLLPLTIRKTDNNSTYKKLVQTSRTHSSVNAIVRRSFEIYCLHAIILCQGRTISISELYFYYLISQPAIRVVTKIRLSIRFPLERVIFQIFFHWLAQFLKPFECVAQRFPVRDDVIIQFLLAALLNFWFLLYLRRITSEVTR